MSECPYKNYKSKVESFIKLLSKPREEFSGLPPCPFVSSEVRQQKLLIDLFDPSKENIIDKVEQLTNSSYESLLLVQIMDGVIASEETTLYEAFINKLLKKSKYKNFKCVCFNPQDQLFASGFNIRSHSPYFLINIADKEVLANSHDNLVKTQYYDKMDNDYLKFIGIKKEDKK
tara:strand:- start:403 stop:924 length:522 start_codon:yes stop_codon:yes gene_type:complete